MANPAPQWPFPPAADVQSLALWCRQVGDLLTHRLANLPSQSSGVVNVKDLGVVGNGVTDDTAALNAAIASIDYGTLLIPPGDYAVSDSIDFLNKNDANDTTQRNLEVIAYGARLVTSVAAGDLALLFDSLKYFTVRGLEVHSANGGIVEFDGFWRSQLIDCKLGHLVAKFGASNLDTFESTYWSKFTNTDFKAHEFHTGGAGSPPDLTEANAIIFDTCRISPRPELSETGAEYAISVYGSQGVFGVQYLNCDLSYYTKGLVYVDEQVTAGSHIDLTGCFFDTGLDGIPADSKGLLVNIRGQCNAANSPKLDSAHLDMGSQQILDIAGGIRNGSRWPMSSYNLIKNGDLRDGTTDITLSSGGSGITATLISGGSPAVEIGLFKQYVNIASTLNRNAEFTSLPVPFDGVYSFTMIARNNGGPLGTAYKLNGVSTVFTAMDIPADGEWAVVSFTMLNPVSAGDVLSLNIFGEAFGSPPARDIDVDIAYVGLTYGRIGQLLAPLHPGAGLARLGEHTAIGAETVTGYITIRDTAGTERKVAIVS